MAGFIKTVLFLNGALLFALWVVPSNFWVNFYSIPKEYAVALDWFFFAIAIVSFGFAGLISAIQKLEGSEI